MEVDGGFGNDQYVGNLFTGLAIFHQAGHLHLLGRQHNIGIGQVLHEWCYDIVQMVFNNLNQGLFFGLQARISQFFNIGQHQALYIGQKPFFEFLFVQIALFEQHL